MGHLRQDVVLLSRLVKGDHDAFVEALRTEPARLERFADFLASHGLQTFVHAQLVRSSARATLPRWWLDRLKAAYLIRWTAQERLVRALDDLASRLAGRHEFILLKGPYSASRFYGELNRREFADLDILIERRDLPAVERLLEATGYVRKSKVVLSRALTARFTHALDFVKRDTALDLHWRLSASAAHALDYAAIWRERRPFTLRGREYSVLSDEYELVFSLISIFKDLERGSARLKAWVDLYFILSALDGRIDWPRFLEHRTREGLRRISVVVLALFLELFDCADRFPGAAAAVARERPLLKASPEPSALLDAPAGALRNKLWAADFYECSRLQVLLWWVVSLPFRVAVHAPGRLAQSRATATVPGTE